MSVVDFSEGILGFGRDRGLVATCLRRVSEDEDENISKLMNRIADNLDRGSRIDIEDIRLIGEKPLYQTQRLFLNAEKEKSSG